MFSTGRGATTAQSFGFVAAPVKAIYMRKMKLLLIPLLTAIVFSTALAEENHWADIARRLDVLNGEVITALATAGGTLYIGVGKSFFTLTLSDTKLVDQTAKIEKSAGDEITSIVVNQENNEVWVSFNNSNYSGKCYRYDLSRCQVQSSFLKDQLQQYNNLPQPSCCAIEAFASEGGQVVEGYFKGNVYLCSKKTHKCSLAYKPTSIYSWPVAVLMTKTTAYAATRGDGLIVIDRKTSKATRFPDKNQDHIRAMAIEGNILFFGATGLYRATVKDFAPQSNSVLKPTP